MQKPWDSSTDLKRPLEEKRGSSSLDSQTSKKEERPFKRKCFTKEFTLDTLYDSKKRTTVAQITLAKHLADEDLAFSQVYLADSGYLELTLASHQTPKDVLSNEVLMSNARRISIVEGAVIGELEDWLTTYCNDPYKEHVLNKGGESLYH